MNKFWGQGFSADLAVTVDFCPITYTVSAGAIDLEFNDGDDLTITLTPEGLDNLIERAVAARTEYRRQSTDA
ncbi:hypothetical protein [Actinokineospora enzanensis]|uniref:hypothetical protein n=1 Tax=Actinokineospora enzanensis TaxID=155975 RepID=UPI00037E98D0|nr:hypothetical protein [Actinokineospora enzanensis]